MDDLQNVSLSSLHLVFIANDGYLVRGPRTVPLGKLYPYVVRLADFVDLCSFLSDDVWMVARLHCHRNTEVTQLLHATKTFLNFKKNLVCISSDYYIIVPIYYTFGSCV